MKIERLTVHKNSSGRVLWERKTIHTKIDEHHFLTQAYCKSNGSEEWLDYGATTNFNGTDKVNGILRTTTVDTVDERFELLVKYEGYTFVE